MEEEWRITFIERQDYDFAYEIEGVARFRANVFWQRKGLGAVLRTIPSKIQTVDALGLPDTVRRMCMLTKGLVLVTGPTGSGKSTTLAAMVDLINETRADHILTIEDPIEFVHQNKKCLINQRETRNSWKRIFLLKFPSWYDSGLTHSIRIVARLLYFERFHRRY